MKSALVYYSVSGQTEFVAKAIARMNAATMFQIETKEKIKSGLIARYIGGFKQMRNKDSPQLLPLSFNAAAFDSIYIGSPTWKSSPPPVVMEFIRQNDFRGTKVFLFCTCALFGGKKCLNIMAKEVGADLIAGKMVFVDPKGMTQLKLKKELIQFLQIE